MKFTVCGGDLRSVFLVRRLLEDGHIVRCFGLETANIPHFCHCTLAEAMEDTDCVILPTPMVQGDVLHAPFSSRPIPIDELLRSIPKEIRVFGGSIPEPLLLQCTAQRMELTDLLSMEALAVKNAAITAECALQLILQEIPYTLAGQSVLILGAGRIGKLLALKLQALGAHVTVTSRTEADQAWCTALGFAAADAATISPTLHTFHLVVNTIPARVLTDAQLQLLPKDALLFELASKPGGFHSALEPLTVISCGGLPGKYAPQSAANAIAETIYHRLEC